MDPELAQLLEAMSQGDPEKMRALVSSGLFGEQMGMAGQDYSTGLGLSQTPSAQGQNVGGTYVSASPLEHIGTALQRVMGGQQMQGAREAQQKAMGGVTDFRSALLKAMSQQGQQPMQPPQWPGVPYPMP